MENVTDGPLQHNLVKGKTKKSLHSQDKQEFNLIMLDHLLAKLKQKIVREYSFRLPEESPKLISTLHKRTQGHYPRQGALYLEHAKADSILIRPTLTDPNLSHFLIG